MFGQIGDWQFSLKEKCGRIWLKEDNTSTTEKQLSFYYGIIFSLWISSNFIGKESNYWLIYCMQRLIVYIFPGYTVEPN